MGFLALLCGVFVCCAGAASPAASAPAAVVRAPADIRALALRGANALLDSLPLPHDAVMLRDDALRAATSGFGDDYAYSTYVEVEAAWRVKESAAVVFAQFGSPFGGATTTEHSTETPQGSSEAWLSVGSPTMFISSRGLAVSVMPASAGAVMVTAWVRVVWIPRRLRVPVSATSAVIASTPRGKVLARVADTRELASIVGAVDALNPDEALHAVYACPGSTGGQPNELRLTFDDAAGNTVAALTTEECPPDAQLVVSGAGSILLQAGRPFISHLQRITGTPLPAGA